MKYRINGAGFPIGDVLLPSGVVVDGSANDHASLIARGHVPPPDATPGDQEAYDAMFKAYGEIVMKFYGHVRG